MSDRAGQTLLAAMREKAAKKAAAAAQAAAAAAAQAAAAAEAQQAHPETPHSKRQRTAASPKSKEKWKGPRKAQPEAQPDAKPKAQLSQDSRKPAPATPTESCASPTSIESKALSSSDTWTGESASTPLSNDDPQKRRANWAKFMRSQEQGSQRANRSDKMPADAALRLLAAGHDDKAWFNLWCQAGGSWGRCLAIMEESRATIKRTSGIDAWLTFDQLVDLYKSEVVAKAIRTKKLQDGRFTVPLCLFICILA